MKFRITKDTKVQRLTQSDTHPNGFNIGHYDKLKEGTVGKATLPEDNFVKVVQLKIGEYQYWVDKKEVERV